MNKILKWLVVVVVAVLAVLVAGGAALPSSYSVARQTVVNAPPERVYGLVASPRAWRQWTVWNRRDPAMQIQYAGPETGAGAQWSWKSQSEGEGQMIFTQVEPLHRVAYELRFNDHDSVASGEMRFAPEGQGTRVVWTMKGDMGRNPLMRWMALAMDRVIGQDFEAGLANLKTLAGKALTLT